MTIEQITLIIGLIGVIIAILSASKKVTEGQIHLESRLTRIETLLNVGGGPASKEELKAHEKRTDALETRFAEKQGELERQMYALEHQFNTAKHLKELRETLSVPEGGHSG